METHGIYKIVLLFSKLTKTTQPDSHRQWLEKEGSRKHLVKVKRKRKKAIKEVCSNLNWQFFETSCPQSYSSKTHTKLWYNMLLQSVGTKFGSLRGWDTNTSTEIQAIKRIAQRPASWGLISLESHQNLHYGDWKIWDFSV